MIAAFFSTREILLTVDELNCDRVLSLDTVYKMYIKL